MEHVKKFVGIYFALLVALSFFGGWQLSTDKKVISVLVENEQCKKLGGKLLWEGIWKNLERPLEAERIGYTITCRSTEILFEYAIKN